MAVNICGGQTVHTPDNCSECDYLEDRIEDLEECCEEVKERLEVDEANTARNAANIATNSENIANLTDIVENLERVTIKIVDELPEIGESNIIYFVPKEGETGNVYEEWIYVNDEWELIGSTEIDLSGYQQKLTAGDNITIENNVISASDGSMTKDEILTTLGYEEVELTFTDVNNGEMALTVLAKKTEAFPESRG